MNSEILEMSKKLGEKIKESDEFLDFKNSKEKMDSDKSLSSLKESFDNKKEELNKEISLENYDKDKVKNLSDELRNLYEKINETPSVKEFESSKEKLSIFIKNINEIIYETAYGKDNPFFSECTGSCDSCTGCL